MNTILTYAGCDWQARQLMSGDMVPNCVYVEYTNGDASSTVLSPAITASTYANLSGDRWYCRAVNKLSGVLRASTVDYAGNTVVFSSAVEQSDQVVGLDKPVYGASSKLCSMALVYAQDETDPSSDVVLAVANFTVNDVFTPIQFVTNVNITVSIPIRFTTTDDSSDSSSSSSSGSYSS